MPVNPSPEQAVAVTPNVFLEISPTGLHTINSTGTLNQSRFAATLEILPQIDPLESRLIRREATLYLSSDSSHPFKSFPKNKYIITTKGSRDIEGLLTGAHEEFSIKISKDELFFTKEAIDSLIKAASSNRHNENPWLTEPLKDLIEAYSLFFEEPKRSITSETRTQIEQWLRDHLSIFDKQKAFQSAQNKKRKSDIFTECRLLITPDHLQRELKAKYHSSITVSETPTSAPPHSTPLRIMIEAAKRAYEEGFQNNEPLIEKLLKELGPNTFKEKKLFAAKKIISAPK